MADTTPRTTAADPSAAAIPATCMTLRELYAAFALVGIMVSRQYENFSPPTQARAAFDLADALLLHGQRTTGED